MTKPSCPTCRVIEYESRASSALQQALEEEARLERARKELAVEIDQADTIRRDMQVCSVLIKCPW